MVLLLFSFYVCVFYYQRHFPSGLLRHGGDGLRHFPDSGFYVFQRDIHAPARRGDLLHDFTFWFVTASLFIFASTIITHLGLFYLYTLNIGDYGNNFYLLSGLVFIIVNILYIKAYLCLRK